MDLSSIAALAAKFYELRLPSFDPRAKNLLVSHTSPRTCVHSETIFPTTCPHRLCGSIFTNTATHTTPVTKRKIVSECSSRNFLTGVKIRCGGRLLSPDPISNNPLVASTVSSTPLQSAIAFPKNARVLLLQSDFCNLQSVFDL